MAYKYEFILEGCECASDEIPRGFFFYIETENGFDIFKKSLVLDKKFIKSVDTFFELSEIANNEMPHRRGIYLNA